MSQLDLSVLADVSARHISFLESGRSKPSQPMAVHLAEALELPRSERNRLLAAAGFAPLWNEHDMHSEQMAPVRKALAWTLDRHNPYPAVVLDRHWYVVDRNRAAGTVFGLLGIEGEISFLDEMTQPDGLRRLIDNWGTVGRFVLSRLRMESAAVGGDAVLDEAVQRLTDDPEIDPTATEFPPVVNLDFRVGDVCISMFSTIAQFGTAEDMALAELRIELFFPADDITGEFLDAIAADG